MAGLSSLLPGREETLSSWRLVLVGGLFVGVDEAGAQASFSRADTISPARANAEIAASLVWQVGGDTATARRWKGTIRSAGEV